MRGIVVRNRPKFKLVSRRYVESVRSIDEAIRLATYLYIMIVAPWGGENVSKNKEEYLSEEGQEDSCLALVLPIEEGRRVMV